jgi:hypothetical protein
MDTGTNDLVAACAGFTVVVFAINTITSKTTMIFKSHNSHVKKPPVNTNDEQGGYFSHSCWLAGKGVNVVGGVRVFFDQVPSPALPGKLALQINRLSLKFWYPDANVAQPFREPDLIQLLTLLGVLPE